MPGFYGGRDLCNRIWAPQTRTTTFVGQKQSQSSTVNVPAGAQPGDLALVYAVSNTTATASGTQAIAAGPSGWTTLASFGVVQFGGGTPVFCSRGCWWKKLTTADIAAGSVTWTPGSLNNGSAATGIMVFRGATTPALVSSTGSTTGQTHVNSTNPAAQAGAKLMVLLFFARADLAETVTPPSVWTNPVPGVIFAGQFFFADPTTYANSIASTGMSITWTTSSPYTVAWLKFT